jgi:hypothetical protein
MEDESPRQSIASRKGINSKFASTARARLNGKRKAQMEHADRSPAISPAAAILSVLKKKKAKPTPGKLTGEGAVSVGPRKRQVKGAVSVGPTTNKGKASPSVAHTADSILQQWSETTEYGIAFRAMTEEDKREEVANVNKGAAKAMKDIMKKKLLGKNFKEKVAQQMREHIGQSRALPAEMFHCAPKTFNVVTSNVRFISVGEWVEVDADRTPGYNSEGGIAVIIAVHDDLADVKYVATKPCKCERLIITNYYCLQGMC